MKKGDAYSIIHKHNIKTLSKSRCKIEVCECGRIFIRTRGKEQKTCLNRIHRV